MVAEYNLDKIIKSHLLREHGARGYFMRFVDFRGEKVVFGDSEEELEAYRSEHLRSRPIEGVQRVVGEE